MDQIRDDPAFGNAACQPMLNPAPCIPMNTASAPSFSDLAMEPLRGALAHLVGGFTASTIAEKVPHGQGEPTLVIPGLGTTGLSTTTLRKFLRSAGYRVYDWGLGRNIGPRGGIDTWLARLQARLEEISGKNGGARVHLVGWSLGGIYARELAKRCPGLVRQVVTLGSPLSGDPEATNGKLLYRLLAGGSAADDEALLARVRVPPRVRCTSLYSKLDGVVSWRSSAFPLRPAHRAFEVEGVSHLGLVSDPRALAAVAQVMVGQAPAQV